MKNTKSNDSARGLPMTAATAAVASLDLISRDEPPMACCPNDMEPLIATFKYPGAEFVCMICSTRYGFLAPTPRKETAELTKGTSSFESSSTTALNREANRSTKILAADC
ncbi:hypothetical protein BH10ACI2_BH10ACI2_00470 [soil metagenome]